MRARLLSERGCVGGWWTVVAAEEGGCGGERRWMMVSLEEDGLMEKGGDCGWCFWRSVALVEGD